MHASCIVLLVIWVVSVDSGIYRVRFLMYSILGLMMGTLYWDTGDEQEEIQDVISVLFFSVAFLSFMSIAAFPAFIEDRVIFARERANGYYQAGPYALSHTIVQIPFVGAIAASFTLITYFMIGLNQEGDRFWYFLIMLFAALYTAESIVVAISAVIPYYIIGIAAGAGFYGYCMLVGGYFLKEVNVRSCCPSPCQKEGVCSSLSADFSPL
jgi:ATP-binding cassette, subfamily G (WHITE), member 2